MIRVKNLIKSYGNSKALDEVSFRIPKGKITALLGPNGAGKTTTMKILNGFLSADSGVIEIDNQIITPDNILSFQKRIGYMPESNPLYTELNTWEHLDFSAKIHGIPHEKRSIRIQEIARMCGVLEKLYFEVSELSKGYRQRLGLAQALIHDPEILILDEPTTGLDPNQIKEMRKLILNWKTTKTILISTHIMQEVEALADHVVVINKGKVVEDAEKEKIMQGENKEKQIYKLYVEVESAQQKAKNIITKIEGVIEISAYNHGFLIISELDIRHNIISELVKNKINLLEISSQKHSMEDVFENLTK